MIYIPMQSLEEPGDAIPAGTLYIFREPVR